MLPSPVPPPSHSSTSQALLAEPQPVPRWWSIIIAAALSIGVLVAFSPALSADFVTFDDPTFVIDNPRVHGFSVENVRWAFTAMHGGHWHPLTWLSWMLDYTLWGGLKPAGFHFTNVLLHAVCAVLVYGLSLRLLTLAQRDEHGASGRAIHIAAGLAAAVFALHPLRAESVVWVTERRDVLSAAFLLGAAITYLNAVRIGAPGVRSPGWYAITCVLLALSLLAKAWGITFFAVMLVLDVFPLRRVPMSIRAVRVSDVFRLVLEKVPLILISLPVAVLAAQAQHGGYASKTLEEWGIHDRLAQSVYGLAWYLWKTVWPMDLSVLYELPASMRLTETRVVLAMVTLGAALAAGVCVRAARAPVLCALAAYVILLAPVLGILQSGEQLVADRYSVLACIAPVLALAHVALRLVSQARRADAASSLPRLMAVVAGVLVLALSMLTFSQSVVWRNSLSLWSSALSATPTPGVRMNYAIELSRLGRQEEAVREMLIVAQERPSDPRVWFSLAEDARKRGQFAQAAEWYRKSAGTSPQAYMALVNLGAMQMRDLKDLPAAIASFRAAVADIERGTQVEKGRRPISYLPYLALGDALARSGDIAGAREAFTKALQGEDTRPSAQAELKKLEAPRLP